MSSGRLSRCAILLDWMSICPWMSDEAVSSRGVCRGLSRGRFLSGRSGLGAQAAGDLVHGLVGALDGGTEEGIRRHAADPALDGGIVGSDSGELRGQAEIAMADLANDLAGPCVLRTDGHVDDD